MNKCDQSNSNSSDKFEQLQVVQLDIFWKIVCASQSK